MGVCATPRDIIFAALSPLDPLLIESALGGDISLDTNDRFYADLARLLIKFKGSKDISMICNRDSRHLLAGNFFNQFLNARRTVQHRIFGVDVEMDETGILRHG